MKTNSISKQLIALILALAMSLSLAACGAGTSNSNDNSNPVSSDTGIVSDANDTAPADDDLAGTELPEIPDPMADAGSVNKTNACTHGQVIELLYKAAGSPKADSAVSWAKANGIIESSSFSADAKATKLNVICYMWRYAGKPESSNQTKLDNLPRKSAIGKAGAWALDQGIIDSSFKRNQYWSYDQVAAILNVSTIETVKPVTPAKPSSAPAVDAYGLKRYGEIQTLVKSVSNPSKPDTNNKQTSNYGVMDYSTAAHGYVTFTPSVENYLFYLIAPDGEYAFLACTTKNTPMKVALMEGTGTYKYVLATHTNGQNATLQYKNTFSVDKFDTDLAAYLVSTPYGDFENAPNAVAKATELWDDSKNQLQNLETFVRYTGALKYDGALAAGGMSTYVNPDTVIKKGGGVCNDKSKLLVAMLRSQGIPAYYQNGNNGSHAWVMAWIELDSTTANGVTTSRGTWVLAEATDGCLRTASQAAASYTPKRFGVN